MDPTRTSSTGVTWRTAVSAVRGGDGAQIAGECEQKHRAPHSIDAEPLETGGDRPQEVPTERKQGRGQSPENGQAGSKEKRFRRLDCHFFKTVLMD